MPGIKMNKTKAEQILEFEEMVKLAGTENCKKCYGRGYEGWSDALGCFLPCDCLIKAEKSITLERIKKREITDAEKN